MTIEALLTSIDSHLAANGRMLATLLGNEGGEAAAGATAATTPARRGRGRPVQGEDAPKTATNVTPAATTQVSQPVATAPADPFDDPPTPVVPAKELTKADVRAALEGFRQKLKAANISIGDDPATAENKATTRALAVLKEVSGETSIAGAEKWTQELLAKTIDGVSKAK